MDLDQNDSAGVQNDDRLTDIPTYAGGGSGDGGDSWAHALLRRGWDLSRKAAIAGAAATAAPVVTPPLIVLSAAGIFLSIPFAAYLAGLAATNHLMGALLPSPPAQPRHTCDQEGDDVEEEFLDASQEYGHEAPVFGHWNETEEDTIKEEDESVTSLPLSRDPGIFDVPVSAFADEDDMDAEGGFAVEDSGQGSFESDCGGKTEESTTMEENESTSITLEALPRGIDVYESSVLQLQDEDSMVQRKGEGEFSAQESGQESFVLKNGNKTEDGTTMEENKPAKEMPSQGLYLSELLVPVSCDDDNAVQREVQGEFAVQKSGQELLASNSGDENEEHANKEQKESTEGTPLRNFDASKSSAPVFNDEDNAVQSKGDGEVAVEVVVEEVKSTTDLVTGEVVDVQVNIVAIAAPESEVLPLSNLAACDSPAMVETAYGGEIVGVTVMEDIVQDFGDFNKEGVEHIELGGVGRFVSVSSVVSVHDDDDDDVLSSGSTQYVSVIRGEMIVESRPEGDQPNQATDSGCMVMNDGFGRKVVVTDENHYTEEQLREQLDTIRTITGYRAVPSSTLEGELAGLYIFVGVEPPVSSRDISDLMDFNAKLRFLKSIIGVD